MACVYFGFGIVLCNNLTTKGRTDDGLWERTWNYFSDIPDEVLVFALAYYSKLKGESSPSWKSELLPHLESLFDQATNYLEDNTRPDLERNVSAHKLYEEAMDDAHRKDHEQAISKLESALFLTTDKMSKALIFNNLGYYQMEIGELDQAIASFKNALKLESNFAYASDNLGYILILKGMLEEGKSYIDRSISTEENEPGYSNRNLALYYAAKGDIAKAEELFQQALQHDQPVDLLEYHYGRFLVRQGNQEEGQQYLQMAADKDQTRVIKVIEVLGMETN